MARTTTAVSPVVSGAAQEVADQLLSRWPGGSLVAAPVARVITDILTSVHRAASAAVGRPISIERWLLAIAGGVGGDGSSGGVTGADLGKLVGSRLSAVLARALDAPPSLAVAGFPLAPATGPVPSLPGYRPPSGWTDREVLRALLSLGRIGATEAATLPGRLAVASSMAGIAVATPGVRSTADAGNTVHRELQGRYRSSYAPPHLVVTDRKVYGGPPPGYSGTSLGKSILGGPPQLAAASLAWMTADFVSSRRADVTNFTTCGNWEIKPLLEAPTGVLQEAWYRCSYNWVAENFAASNPAFAGLLPPLLPGTPWELSLMRPVPVSGSGGPAMAVPFSTLALPGMIVYAVVSGPRLADLAILVALMMQLIEREARRQLEQALAAVKAVLQQVVDALAAIGRWIADHLVALAVIIAVAGLAVLLIATAPAWPVLAGAGALLGLGTAAATGILLFGPVGRSDRSGSSGNPEQPVPIDFGPVTVAMPPSYLPRFIAGLGPVLVASLSALTSAAPPTSAV